MADGYDPQKSRVAEDTLADFLRAPLTGDLTEVPGIGKAAVTKLCASDEDGDEAVTNTFQLVGKFLMLKVRWQMGTLSRRVGVPNVILGSLCVL